jgi:hypothetical protein
MPLFYAHLFVRPLLPIYADTVYNKDFMEDMLAFAVGQKEKFIMDNLQYDTSASTPVITHPTSDFVSPKAGALLMSAHYNLMMKHKFVIPTDATQEHILFDEIQDPPNRSQHLDHIAAVCHVRYNWVFDLSKFRTTYTLQPLGTDSPYHAVDVHRHITHLQRKSSDPESDFLKTLSTGFYVSEIAGQ